MNPQELLDRSGFANLDDLDSRRYKEILPLLEASARSFEEASPAFRSPEHPWPLDPLHQWSRIWEYPDIWHHLERLLPTSASQVMDLGSGVTFFPFALATRGIHTLCVDIDPMAGRDLARAVEAMQPAPGGIAFQLTEGGPLEVPDGTMDAVYCISVLEHVPDPASLIPEITRVLKPGGLFLLTIDVAMEGRRADIKPEQYRALRRMLGQHFEFVFPEDSVHPQRVLTTDHSPFPVGRKSPLKAFFRRLERGLTRAFLDRERGTRLCCQGFVLQKK